MLASAFEVTGTNGFLNCAVRASGERVQAGGVLGDEGERRLRLGLLTRELGCRDRPAEGGPALAVAGDEDEVTPIEEL